jgi:hypothetical protein
LGEMMLSLCYLPTAGRLTVTIIKARNLKAMDITGSSGKYLLYLVPSSSFNVTAEPILQPDLDYRYSSVDHIIQSTELGELVI